MTAIFYHKPTVVSAYQVPAPGDELPAGIAPLVTARISHPAGVEINTPAGLIRAKTGDWIVFGAEGSIEVHTDAAFHDRYEPALEPVEPEATAEEPPVEPDPAVEPSPIDPPPVEPETVATDAETATDAAAEKPAKVK